MPQTYDNIEPLLNFIRSKRVAVTERLVDEVEPAIMRQFFGGRSSDAPKTAIVFDFGKLSFPEQLIANHGMQEIGYSTGGFSGGSGEGRNEHISTGDCARRTKEFLLEKGIDVPAIGRTR